MKNDKKFEIMIMFCLIFFTLLIFGIYLIIELFNKKNTYTLIFSPYSVLECVKYKCTNKSNELSVYNNSKFDTLIDGEYKGKNKLYYNNSKVYIFSPDNKNIFKNSKYALMYETNSSLNQYLFEEKELNDNSVLKRLKEVTKLNELKYVKYVTYDFDGDNENEILYLINSGFTADIYYNAIVYKNNNKYNLVETNTYEEMTDYKFISVTNIIDIFTDGKIEFIITNEHFDNLGYCNILYRLKGNKYVPTNECEIVN